MQDDHTKGPRGSTITRRQLLQRLGMVGGSSMLLGAMNALDLMAEPIGPKPVLEQSGEGVRILILGAGVSGLVTGYELGKAGYDYRILEARDRVGGLNWTITRGTSHTELGPGGEKQVCEFDRGQYMNGGPWRLQHNQEGIIGYCHELGVRLERFNDVNSVLYTENPNLGKLSKKKVRMREIQSDLWGQTSELLAKALDQGSLDQAVSGEDKERLLEFLVRAGYLNSEDYVYQPNPLMRGSEGKYELSNLLRSSFIRDVRSVNAGIGGPAPVFQPTGGMMQIPLAFERVIGDRITYGAEVVSVHQTEDEVNVVYRNTASGKQEQVTADYVIFSLPMGILKKLDVNFSPEMKAAIEPFSHSTSSKMGLQMARRFWEEDDGIYGGHLAYVPYDPDASGQGGGFFRGPLPQFSYPSNDYRSDKGVLLGFYGPGQMPGLDGKPLIDSPVQSRIDYVLKHASVVHPQMREEYESAYCVWWPKVPHSEGAWASNPGGRLKQLRTPDGRFFVGSAGVSSDPAWQEGAVESAWAVIKNVQKVVANA